MKRIRPGWFTLIELLVVVAIIGFPCMSQACSSPATILPKFSRAADSYFFQKYSVL